MPSEGADFLRRMLEDPYFPAPLVEKGQRLLLELAERIEREAPVGGAVVALTHATTEAFNRLQVELQDAGSDLETEARETIAEDNEFILDSYGYQVELEEAIAPREW